MNEEVRKYLSEIGRRGGKVSGGKKALKSAENGRRGFPARKKKDLKDSEVVATTLGE